MANRTPDSPRLGLKSRHLFLDTEVFKSRGHNLTVQPFPALAAHLRDEKIQLHTTDITLSEIERQIISDASELATQIRALSRKVESWKHKAPHAKLSPVVRPDANEVGVSAWNSFRHTLRLEWGCREHAATEIAASEVFDKYFKRLPPFGEHDSKEFPDAFVVAALERWCSENDEVMYVVTRDKAFRAAAAASNRLLPIASLEEFLQKVTEAETPRAVRAVEVILEASESQHIVGAAIEQQFHKLGFMFAGDLHEGEVSGAEFVQYVELTDFWIVAQENDVASLIGKVRVDVNADVSFEDISDAIYDKEDGIYFGAETVSMEIPEQVTVRIFLKVDLQAKSISECELLPDDVLIEYYYDFDR